MDPGTVHATACLHLRLAIQRRMPALSGGFPNTRKLLQTCNIETAAGACRALARNRESDGDLERWFWLLFEEILGSPHEDRLADTLHSCCDFIFLYELPAMNLIFFQFFNCVEKSRQAYNLLAKQETDFVQILQGHLATIQPSKIHLFQVPEDLNSTLEIGLVHIKRTWKGGVQHATLHPAANMPTSRRISIMWRELVEELDEAHLRAPTHCPIPQRLRVQQTGRHGLVGVQRGEALFRRPRV
mmetsp:Transcript_26745/g.70247  ORF Transcript_26745/g.70247 Transcript_26745/m.70247 type:complete len:243 (+) Transcript_26745:947-1675(+)